MLSNEQRMLQILNLQSKIIAKHLWHVLGKNTTWLNAKFCITAKNVRFRSKYWNFLLLLLCLNLHLTSGQSLKAEFGLQVVKPASYM